MFGTQGPEVRILSLRPVMSNQRIRAKLLQQVPRFFEILLLRNSADEAGAELRVQPCGTSDCASSAYQP